MTGPRHYRAFISYSHADVAQATWLQRALERYRPPKALRRARPDLPERLYPIFRDTDELASATDLSESIQKAMDDSEALIVICSPAARASTWVDQEIRRFRASGRRDRIFCLIVSGSPDSRAADCAFPDALLHDEEGRALHEPLAADLTAAGEGKRNALLKIAAGLLNVGVDELRRRDAQRRARFWSVVAAGSLLVTAFTIALAAYALHARREAEIRRAQAENLIGFMLGDLRKNLERIGKLELLDSIGNQATAYFAAIGEQGTEKEMLERARALKQIGDVRFSRGQLGPALEAFRQALSQTQTLYESNPANDDYLFELGQAEFWVGYVAWQRGDLEGAFRSMRRYMQYSSELTRRAPRNDAYQLELSYAHGNLGSVGLAQGRLDVALPEFQLAAALAETLLDKSPNDYDLAFNLADTQSWIGTTLLELGRLAEARHEFAAAVGVMRPFHENRQDERASYNYARLLILQADADIMRGEVGEARSALHSALAVYGRLLKLDPTNTTWRYNALTAETFLLGLTSPERWSRHDYATLDRIESTLAGSGTGDAADKDYIRLVFRVRNLRDAVLLHQGDAQAALSSARQTAQDWQRLTRGKTLAPEFTVIDAKVNESLGSALAAAGNLDEAHSVWRSAADKLGARAASNLSVVAVRRLLALHLGETAQAEALGARLAQAGYRDPRIEYRLARLGALHPQ